MRIVLLFSLLISITIHANNKWIGRWQSNPMSVDNETLVMEYDFKNDSLLSMRFFTDNRIPNVGRCVSKISIDGTYNSIGPMFFVSLDDNTLNVEILKFYAKGSAIAEKAVEQSLRKHAGLLFAGYDNVSMIYVTHEKSDEISFVYGDESNAMEIVFHRPNQSIKQIFKIAEDETKVTESATKGDKIYRTISPIVTGQSVKQIPKIPDVRTEVSKPTTNGDGNTKKLSLIVKMLKSLGYFLIYLVVAFPLIFLFKLLFARNIKRTNTVKKSVMIRRAYYIIRFVVRIIVLIIGLLLWIPLLEDAMDVNKYIAAIVLCGGGGFLIHVFSSLSLPMNFTTMRSFLRKKRTYILYLRGFVTDDYSPKMAETATKVSKTRPWITKSDKDEEKIDPCNLPLVERELAKAWEKLAPVYSVGLPEELESPEGSKRIYLDNQTWQEDVLQLISDAKYIIIRVNPNDNCIWEIQQCYSLYPNKTIYYIENIELLKDIQDKMGTSIPTCLNPSKIDRNHMYAHQTNGEIIVQSYDNSFKGFAKSVSDVISCK